MKEKKNYYIESLTHVCWDSNSHINDCTLCVDRCDAFGGAHVPYANGFVSRRSDEQIRVGWMPAQLINTVTMSSVVVLLHLEKDKNFRLKCQMTILQFYSVYSYSSDSQ